MWTAERYDRRSGEDEADPHRSSDDCHSRSSWQEKTCSAMAECKRCCAIGASVTASCQFALELPYRVSLPPAPA
jgi:hypothetical protein